MSKQALNIQEDSRCKGILRNTSKAEIKCVCLNSRSIISKKNELNITVDDIKPHIIGKTESWAHNDITDAELGLEVYVMVRKASQKEFVDDIVIQEPLGSSDHNQSSAF